MYRQQERAHTSSILEPNLIKVPAGQKVRYAVIKSGVRRRPLWTLIYSELTVTDLFMPDCSALGDWDIDFIFLLWHVCSLSAVCGA